MDTVSHVLLPLVTIPVHNKSVYIRYNDNISVPINRHFNAVQLFCNVVGCVETFTGPISKWYFPWEFPCYDYSAKIYHPSLC